MRPRTGHRRHVVSALLLALAGCGGGGGDDGTDVTLLADPAVHGWVTNLGGSVSFGGSVVVGDSSGNPTLAARGIMRFQLTDIPAGATIESATLRVYQMLVEGTPYADLGDLLVDHVDAGAGLSADDFAGGTLQANMGVLSTSAALEIKSLDVRAAVQAALDGGTGRVDFRFRFETETDGDAQTDGATLNGRSDEAGNGRVPVLEVTYQ